MEEAQADKGGYQTSVTAVLGTAAADDSVSGTLTDDETIGYANARDGFVPTGLRERTIPAVLITACAAALIAFLEKRKKGRKA